MKTFWDDLLAFNETVATDFPCTHVYMRHTHTHQGWYLGGWMDLCMLSLLERIIYHSLSHSVSCKKFPRVKLDIAVACEKKKKKVCWGRAFHFYTGGTQSRWKKSSRHTVGGTEAYTSLYFSSISPAKRKAEAEIMFKRSACVRSAEENYCCFLWGNAQLSQGWKCPEQKLIYWLSNCIKASLYHFLLPSDNSFRNILIVQRLILVQIVSLSPPLRPLNTCFCASAGCIKETEPGRREPEPGWFLKNESRESLDVHLDSRRTWQQFGGQRSTSSQTSWRHILHADISKRHWGNERIRCRWWYNCNAVVLFDH